MENVFDTLKARGLIAQVTHEDELRELLGKEKVKFYIGFDPTADSLHVGHFLQMVVMRHMQNAGHTPIALIGAGTAMVGDPSGRTDMRQMMTRETINYNSECFKKQLSSVIDFSDNKAIMVNNADWLLELNYIEFLRDIGSCFSVNEMLRAKCFQSRLEKGLSFLEFNYMLMQSYDFLQLYKTYGCKLELGGDDQWSNILGGIDLVRRKEADQVFGMTFTLLTNSEGKKMGKTAKGALWLDPEKVSPYDFYQYWRNVDDADVCRFLKLVTFVDLKEIEEMEKWEGSQLNEAKKRLAFEVTKLVHGEENALAAQETATNLFSAGGAPADMPSTELEVIGMNIMDVLVAANLCPSKSEARRLVQQGGVSVDGEKASLDFVFEDSSKTEFIIKKGKKVYHKIIVK
ncbi:MAG: tyrosine--tRNA ligase [Monoglobales bacterium]